MRLIGAGYTSNQHRLAANEGTIEWVDVFPSIISLFSLIPLTSHSILASVPYTF